MPQHWCPIEDWCPYQGRLGTDKGPAGDTARWRTSASQGEGPQENCGILLQQHKLTITNALVEMKTKLRGL